MAIAPRQIDEAANRRTGLRVIGVILILLSITAVIYGIGELNSSGATPSEFSSDMVSAVNRGSSFTALFMMGGGAIGLLLGFGCFTATAGRREESDQPMTESGRTCSSCGLLNEPGAATCEACGEPLAG